MAIRAKPAQPSEALEHRCPARIAQGTICKICDHHAVKPHKVRRYLEGRDDAFEAKRPEVLCVCREVAVLQQDAAPSGKVAFISYAANLCIHAIGYTVPDLPPKSGSRAIRAACS